MHRALEAKRESKTIDFKRTFNPDQGADWCELVKDIVAMANSGGGYIIVGVNDDGSSAGDAYCEALLGLDPAQLTD
jgi:predicted HTH transcriptional regulator